MLLQRVNFREQMISLSRQRINHPENSPICYNLPRQQSKKGIHNSITLNATLLSIKTLKARTTNAVSTDRQ